MNQNFVVTAPKGVIGLLRAELRAMGIDAGAQGPAALLFEGGLAAAYRVCLWSRVASRVLMPLAETRVNGPDALYDFVRTIDWSAHLGPADTLAVDCTAAGSVLPHSQYAALKVKDAIVDQFREHGGARPSVDLERPTIRINLHVRSEKARLSLDLSGASLHRRGYRTEAGAAPLKENLAAALLLAADWPALAAGGFALADPLCGAGTLLIEAAMIAADAAPGRHRDYYGFLGWRGHDAGAWQALLAEADAREAAGRARMPLISGADSDSMALVRARENLARAGFANHVTLNRRDLRQGLELPEAAGGLLITNPPYGERIGADSGLPALYAALGDAIAKHPGWRAAVFTADATLAGYIGLAPQRIDTLYNGPIECRLLHFTQTESAHDDAATMFVNRLRKNLKHLGRWARREGIAAFRVYDRDLPEFAFAVDCYDLETANGSQRWAHIQEYDPPKSVDAERAERRRVMAVGAVAEALEIPREHAIMKHRARQRGRAQYQKLDAQSGFHPVHEGAARLLVNLTDYLDTGLFLDHRPVRLLIAERAGGKRFLNLYCYTATASVHAALGGATESVSVDLSNTYLDWAERNFRLNRLDEKRHRLVRADAQTWLEQAAERPARFDLIFLDPPTFSNSKRMEDVLDIQRDHVRLITDAARLLTADGELIFSTNFRRFTLDTAALAAFAIEDWTARTTPEDFKRQPKVHQCWRITAANRR
ncbi:MAG: bifunctional 23S rRNA (guanine(2069)-N(7))-methyltransferase RlmK/23S rRNA (guanine(2445)-N(2))-methyltransferase RlmL [Chromatiales bacterium]|nr:bifunctional 23S rRNA (guanine(2069)-N(7))-methyltransferase RlmK/23S rRNA (guanine(2445)-N(2))-methyltransferase RlmL [Chromatiales bacterium]